MSSSLALVPIQPNLSQDIKRAEIMKIITDRISELNLPLVNYKNNTEFVLLVLNLIEHLVQNKKGKPRLDKKQLAIDILTNVLHLSASDAGQLGINIEFLHSNKMIKKVSKFWLFCCGVSEYFGKKK